MESSPKYKLEEIQKIKDDYLLRKIDEHLRIDRLVKANKDVLAYKVKAKDPEFPHPPTEYHVTFIVRSIVGISEDQTPRFGDVHELRIKVPRTFPEQTVESRMLSQVWHPNIKSAGSNVGDICTNHKGFGSLYTLDELIVRIGEYLQYKRYLAEDRKPWPEDPAVARWVRNFAEPHNIINKDEGRFTDNYAWNVFFEDPEFTMGDDWGIEIVELEFSGDETNASNPDSTGIEDVDNNKKDDYTTPSDENDHDSTVNDILISDV